MVHVILLFFHSYFFKHIKLNQLAFSKLKKDGLNLVGANHMFLLDMHWNPAIESQASDRIFRKGQTKKVYIYTFLGINTIEASIKELQTKKIELAENFVNANAKALALSFSYKLTVNDLKNLFQL